MRNKEFKLKDLSYFTEEEVHILERIIDNMDCTEELKENGKEKLTEICATYLEQTGKTLLRSGIVENTDCFRVEGEAQFRIKLQLNEFAKDALLRKYPLTEKDLTEADDKWMLDTSVCALEEPCRFVLSYADEIEIIDSPLLKEYVETFVEKYLKA